MCWPLGTYKYDMINSIKEKTLTAHHKCALHCYHRNTVLFCNNESCLNQIIKTRGTVSPSNIWKVATYFISIFMHTSRKIKPQNKKQNWCNQVMTQTHRLTETVTDLRIENWENHLFTLSIMKVSNVSKNLRQRYIYIYSSSRN